MSAFTDTASIALIHSIWQNSCVAIILWMSLMALRRRSANARYAASCVALGLMGVLPILTMGSLYLRAFPPEVVWRGVTDVVHVIVEHPQDLTPVWTGPRLHDVAWIVRLQPWVLPVWSCGVLLFSFRLLSSIAQVNGVRRRSEPADDVMDAMVTRIARRMGLERSVRVLVSGTSEGPATIGWLWPIILMPPASVLALTPHQLEAVLAHELAHIRRHDYVVNGLQLLLETLLFYHPGVWWASKQVRLERELCCDDLAVRSCGDARCYALALTNIAKGRVAAPNMAVGAAGGPLVRRIERLLAGPVPRPPASRWPTVLAVTLAVAWGALNLRWIHAHAQGDDAAAAVSGLWELRPSTGIGGVQLTLCYADEFSQADLPVDRFEGFSPEWLRQDGLLPVFSLRRDAGIFSFNGTVQSGIGGGIYRFEPAAAFPMQLEQRGVAPPTSGQQAKWPGLGTWPHTFALYDIGFSLVDDLRAQGVLDPDPSQIVRRAQMRERLTEIQQLVTVRSAARVRHDWC